MWSQQVVAIFLMLQYKVSAATHYPEQRFGGDGSDIGDIDYSDQSGSGKLDEIRGARGKNATANNGNKMTENPVDIGEKHDESINYANLSGETTTNEQNTTINTTSETMSVDFNENHSQAEDSPGPTHTPSAAIPNGAKTEWPPLAHINLANYHRLMIDYIVHLLCHDGSYEFVHVYVERSLATRLADALIMQLNHCMFAGVLTSR